MDLLPKEILNHICSYLSQFEQIAFSRINKYASNNLYPTTLKMRDIHISYLTHRPNIQILNIMFARLGYNIIIPQLPKLHTLFLGRLGSNITHLTNLTSLSLSSSSNISCNNFNILSLKKLDITNCEHITNIFNISLLTNLEHLAAQKTPILTQHLTSLTKLSYLNISYTKVNHIDTLLNLTKLICLQTPLSNITHLTNLLNLVSGGRNNKIIEINSLTNLTKLVLDRFSAVKEIDNLINLNTLCINESKIKNISTLTNLTELEATGNYYLNDGTLRPLTRLECLSVSSDINSIQFLTNLDYLNIDIVFESVNLNSLQKLETLILNHSNINTDNIIELTKLKRLSITGQHNDLDLNHLTNLKKLNLFQCKIDPAKYDKIRHLVKSN